MSETWKEARKGNREHDASSWTRKGTEFTYREYPEFSSAGEFRIVKLKKQT